MCHAEITNNSFHSEGFYQILVRTGMQGGHKALQTSLASVLAGWERVCLCMGCVQDTGGCN